ncbi:penicillin-binding protein [Aspergillus cavernicola]|uniref:Penicillin-binding protein n=1 Tax=Aspergillus cavernicola TaxID=176166 RepID=A0ABR4IHS0_9EURO
MGSVLDYTPTPLNEEFEKLVYETQSFWKIPGISVAVVDGATTWTEGYGMADESSATKVEANTLFYGGSTTKAFTAAILSILVEDNDQYPQIHWDTPVGELLRDDFVLDHTWTTANITIEDILSHRTGMPGHNLAFGGEYDGHQATVRDLVRNLRFLPSTKSPRTTFQYNNVMFIAASHLIETVLGDGLGSVFAKYIWDPLEMSSTYLSLHDALASQKPLAKGYTFEHDRFEEVPWKDRPEISGAGAIISNVGDYAKWVNALLNQTMKPLSPEGYRAIWSPRTIMPTQKPFLTPLAYDLGWDRYVYHGVEIITHDGGIDGFGAEIVLIPELKYGVITMANSTHTSNYGGTCLAYHLVDNKLNIPVGQRFDWKENFVDLIQQMNEDNKNALQRFYPDLPPPPRPPPTLPLEAYTGTYWNDGYRQLEIFLGSDNNLHANRTDYTTASYLTFEHVSQDYFLVTVRVVGAEIVAPAEFLIGSDQQPAEVGIGWEPAMGDKKIWMQRVHNYEPPMPDL